MRDMVLLDRGARYILINERPSIARVNVSFTRARDPVYCQTVHCNLTYKSEGVSVPDRRRLGHVNVIYSRNVPMCGLRGAKEGSGS